MPAIRNATGGFPVQAHCDQLGESSPGHRLATFSVRHGPAGGRPRMGGHQMLSLATWFARLRVRVLSRHPWRKDLLCEPLHAHAHIPQYRPKYLICWPDRIGLMNEG